jgi:hypothetical protein
MSCILCIFAILVPGSRKSEASRPKYNPDFVPTKPGRTRRSTCLGITKTQRDGYYAVRDTAPPRRKATSQTDLRMLRPVSHVSTHAPSKSWLSTRRGTVGRVSDVRLLESGLTLTDMMAGTIDGVQYFQHKHDAVQPHDPVTHENANAGRVEVFVLEYECM